MELDSGQMVHSKMQYQLGQLFSFDATHYITLYIAMR